MTPDESLKQAEVHLKTSFFKWKPDHFMAGLEYENAAKGFFVEQKFDQCMAAHVLSAQQKKEGGDSFQAARSYEEASRVANDKLKRVQDALQLLQEALQIYKLLDKEEPSCRLAAKKVEIMTKNNEDIVQRRSHLPPHVQMFSAAELRKAYDDCIALYTHFEKWYPLADFFPKFCNFMVQQLVHRACKPTEVYEVLDRSAVAQRRLKQNVQKELLSKIVVCLYADQDLIRVQLFLEESYGWGPEDQAGPDMCSLGEKLQEAFRTRDAALLERTQRSQLFSFLPLEVARLVRELRVDAGTLGEEEEFGTTDQFGTTLPSVEGFTAGLVPPSGGQPDDDLDLA